VCVEDCCIVGCARQVKIEAASLCLMGLGLSDRPHRPVMGEVRVATLEPQCEPEVPLSSCPWKKSSTAPTTSRRGLWSRTQCHRAVCGPPTGSRRRRAGSPAPAGSRTWPTASSQGMGPFPVPPGQIGCLPYSQHLSWEKGSPRTGYHGGRSQEPRDTVQSAAVQTVCHRGAERSGSRSWTAPPWTLSTCDRRNGNENLHVVLGRKDIGRDNCLDRVGALHSV